MIYFKEMTILKYYDYKYKIEIVNNFLIIYKI